MRVHRKYKSIDGTGLVSVSNCSAGLSGEVHRISDTEYTLTQIAAYLKNSKSVDPSTLPVEPINGVYVEEVASE